MKTETYHAVDIDRNIGNFSYPKTHTHSTPASV